MKTTVSYPNLVVLLFICAEPKLFIVRVIRESQNMTCGKIRQTSATLSSQERSGPFPLFLLSFLSLRSVPRNILKKTKSESTL